VEKCFCDGGGAVRVFCGEVEEGCCGSGVLVGDYCKYKLPVVCGKGVERCDVEGTLWCRSFLPCSMANDGTFLGVSFDVAISAAVTKVV
jgi:hypothetical protein